METSGGKRMAEPNDGPRAASESELLRALAEKSSAMLAYWDASLRCRFANRAYERWFGVSPEALLGKHIRELLGPLYEKNLPYIEGVLRGEPQEFEREIPDPKGGPPRHSLASYVPDLVEGRVRGFFVFVSDISSVKRAETALRESEERFRLTLDEAPIGMALVAPDGRFFRVNRALCEIVGYSAEELTGLTFQAITHPEDLDVDLELADKLARGEIPRYQLEKRYLRKDGSTVEIMLSGSVLRGADGAPRYFIAQVEDIAERKRVQRELRQNQERFELALEGADLGSWDWNVQTGEVVFNRRWAQMRGFRPEEVRPHVDSWSSGVHPEDLPLVQAALEAHFQGRTSVYETEHRVRTRSGQWLWVLDRGKLFARDAQGRPLRMVGTELDITERKRVQDQQAILSEVGKVLSGTLEFEETLTGIARLSVQHLADCVVLDVAEEGESAQRVVVLCADPTQTLRCERLRRLRLEARSPSQVSSLLETRAPVLLSRLGAEPPMGLGASAPHEEQLRVLEELGARSLMAVPLRSHGRWLGSLLFISSSEARVYGPPDLEFAQELAGRAALALDNARLYETARSATQWRDEVMGFVAHDLRNPLSTVLMQTALMRRRPPEPERRSTRGVEGIERAVHRMKHLIQDLLDVTRMEAGRFSVEKARLPAAKLVSDAVDAHQALAASAQVRLELAPALEAALPEVWGDRHRLLQVFENLLGNALKFTPPGGRVTAGAAPQGNEVRFWVTDTGEGIASEDLPHLFDRFWQAHKGRRQGAGLGLPIVKGIIELHGGRIGVESAPGRGSTFSFTLPAAFGAQARVAEPAPQGV